MRGLRKLGLALCCLAASPGWCSDATTGAVTLIAPDGGNVSFTTAGSRSAAPACATDPLWIVNSSNGVLLAAVMSMYFAGRSFEVHGTGTCQGTREVVAWIVAT